MRVVRGILGTRKRKKILKQASGYFGSRHKTLRIAKESINKALQYAYRDRKVRKRLFRRLWVARINAYAKSVGINYNFFINSLKKK